MKKTPIVALIYDFDGTLSPGNMQEFGFIQAIGKSPAEFWQMSDDIAIGQDASNILSYMKLMFDEARKAGISLQREKFRSFGKSIELFDGVREWFGLINEYGRRHGVTVEHYINSSGLAEMIEGSPIADEFKRIFACSFLYDENGNAVWPGVAVDYTAKTQFIFKINKAAHDIFRRRRDRCAVHEDCEDVRRTFHCCVQPVASRQARDSQKAPQAETRELHHSGMLYRGQQDIQGSVFDHRQDKGRPRAAKAFQLQIGSQAGAGASGRRQQ